jgi:alkanesulfonate monooxygenase SsuD/methylene tetrahydromethanopterin reductase-like flavin-dependent oxidoreductase (luciferase family)
MPDHGRTPEFGIFVIPEAGSLDEARRRVAGAERLGLDLVGIQDHPYQRRFVDTFALITALAATTERIRFFPDVACLPLRPPAVLAKTAATIDLLSGGRFELGLGAGAFWDAIAGYGGPRRSPGEALGALEEAIDVVRLLWSGERSLRYDGDHYRLDGVHAGPVPAHDVGIWLGVGGPRALDLLGRKADGWVPSLPRTPLTDLAGKQATIDDAARAAGRDPSAIRRVANVNGRITDHSGEGSFDGPADDWVELLTDLVVTHGFDGFVFWPDGDPAGQVERFADVAAAVREAVAGRRAR